MAHDPVLAERIRDLLADAADVTERKMFGGVAFLVAGHLAVAASGQGGVLVRVAPATSDALVSRSRAERAVMRGRPMDGWVRVHPDHLGTRRQLASWVDRGTTYARSLPPKPAGDRRAR